MGEATLLLGVKTSSGDHTDEIVDTQPVPSFLKDEIETIFKSLIGEIEQTVPITSAVHVNGRKLYQYAHLNQEVDVPRFLVMM